jgi:hypothetical protein
MRRVGADIFAERGETIDFRDVNARISRRGMDRIDCESKRAEIGQRAMLAVSGIACLLASFPLTIPPPGCG